MRAEASSPTGVNETYTDVIYGATAWAIFVNLACVVLMLYIATKLWPTFVSLHRGMTPGQGVVFVVGSFVFVSSYIVIRLEEALHAYVQYGATWQVSEHGLFFLAGRLAGVSLLAWSCWRWTRDPGRHEVGARPVDKRP